MSERTEIRPTGTAKGRGVFALRDFANGEVVEVARVLLGKFGGGGGGAFKLQRLSTRWRPRRRVDRRCKRPDYRSSFAFRRPGAGPRGPAAPEVFWDASKRHDCQG